jgi:vancomycin resistance protein YoaR
MENNSRERKRKGRKKTGQRKRKLGRTLLVIGAAAMLLIAAVLACQKYLYHDLIYHNIYIDDLSIGGLTREQAVQQLNSAWQDRKNQIEIHLVYRDQEWVFHHEDIQPTSNYEQLVDKAYSTGRSRGFFTRIKKIFDLKNNPVRFATEINYETNILQRRLNEIAKQLNLEPADATLTFYPDASDPDEMFVITKEQAGRVLQTQLMLEEIEKNLKQKIFDFSVELRFEEVSPQVYAEDFAGKTEKLIAFGTDLSRSAPDRTHNVVKAALEFNGVVLQPGEILSFNEQVGERTAEKGYRSAPMIVADKSLQDAIGGGVSQTSTTLYNAAIRAGLDVVEFQRHSFPISYIEKGLDTTVNLPFPIIDLKIKNTKNSPVYFRTFYAGQKVYFEIYGEPLPNGRTIRIRTEEYETIAPPPPEIRRDREGKYVIYEDQKYIHVESRNGYKVRVYREYMEGDRVIDSELLDDHYYRPIAGIIYVGVNKRPAPESTEGTQDNAS